MSAIPVAELDVPAKRRRRGIFVETGWGRQKSAAGAAYFDVVPTEPTDFAGDFPQRFRAYGAGAGSMQPLCSALEEVEA